MKNNKDQHLSLLAKCTPSLKTDLPLLMNRTLQTNLPNIKHNKNDVTQLTTGKSCYVHKLSEPNNKVRTEFINHCLRIYKILKKLAQPCS